MQAITFSRYGGSEVLNLRDIPRPQPNDDEVLIKIYAASINAADWHLLRGEPVIARIAFGLFRPKYNILGADVAGIVEVVGKNVSQFKVGDAVIGDLAGAGFGTFAEYVAAPARDLILKPQNLTFGEAAALPLSSVTALQALRAGAVTPGTQVLVNGASGGVGAFVVQIAKILGAEVTGVCSTRNIDLVRSIGADHVIDYTVEDFTSSGKQYDLILGIHGYHSIADYRRALKVGGAYIMVGGTNKQMFEAIAWSPFYHKTNKKVRVFLAKPNTDDLTFIKELVESGKLKPVIDRNYTLGEVPKAIQYFGEGHARGKVVINILPQQSL